MSIDWGDVPTWVSALTTLGALIAAARVVKIELDREGRAEELRADQRNAEARTQADLVAAWQAPGAIAQLMVMNSSPLPIYNVGLALLFPDDPGRPMFTEARSVLPPGQHAFDYPAELVDQLDNDGLGNYGDGSTYEAWEDLLVSLHFRDTAGRKWIRHPDGWLEQVGQTSR